MSSKFLQVSFPLSHLTSFIIKINVFLKRKLLYACELMDNLIKKTSRRTFMSSLIAWHTDGPCKLMLKVSKAVV